MRKFLGGLLFATFLGSCAGVPQLDIPNALTVGNIVDRVECEAWLAREKYPQLADNRWVGVADLFLQVDDSAGLTPTVSFIEPLAAAGTKFAFGASATLKRARQRVYNESIKLDMAKLNGGTCSKNDSAYDLAGELGIAEAIDIGFQSIDKNNTAAFSDKVAIGQTLQFILTRNVSGTGPTWTLAHFIGPGGLAGAERIDTHKLIVSFTPGTPPRVVTVNGKKITQPGTSGSLDKAIRNNQNLLLQSLPFQSIR